MGDKKGAVGSKGSLVGYQIRLESKTSDTNILQFCTTVCVSWTKLPQLTFKLTGLLQGYPLASFGGR